MIESIGLKNIRVFKDLTEFELKPLTILTGPNNSGKSTLQKALMLLSSGLVVSKDIVDIENLIFKKEFINKTGDFESNVNFDSKSNDIAFSFRYNDELFGDVKAILTYSKNINDLNGSLNKIEFFDKDENKLFSLEKKLLKEITNEEHDNDEVWSWNIEQINLYFPVVKNKLLELRELGFKQRLLKDIYIKLSNDPTSFKNISEDDRIIIDYFKSLGIIINDERAIKSNDYDDYYDKSWNIWDSNTNDIYIANKLADSLVDDFPSENSNYLFYSKLLEIVGENYDDFLKIQDEKHFGLKKKLINEGITDNEKFKELISKYENKKIISILTELIQVNDIGLYEETISFSIIEMFNKNSKGMFDSDECLITKILLEEGIIKQKENTIPIDTILDITYGTGGIGGSKIKDDKKDIDKDEKCSRSFSKYFLFPAKTLLQSLKDFIYLVNISSQNHIYKKQYMFGDNEVIDSPFLQYGYTYINSDNTYLIKSMSEFINKWLSQLGIAEELKVSKINIEDNKTKKTLGFYFSLLINNTNVPLSDNGLGVNQLVLLLLKIVLSKKNSILLIEEPEIGMHPALQSKLTELFVDANKNFGVKFIIETHSEYLVRKLQYLTLNGNISRENSIIYYVNSDSYINEKEPKVREININEEGGLSDVFGRGFFDEATKLHFDLMKLRKSQDN